MSPRKKRATDQITSKVTPEFAQMCRDAGIDTATANQIRSGALRGVQSAVGIVLTAMEQTGVDADLVPYLRAEQERLRLGKPQDVVHLPLVFRSASKRATIAYLADINLPRVSYAFNEEPGKIGRNTALTILTISRLLDFRRSEATRAARYWRQRPDVPRRRSLRTRESVRIEDIATEAGLSPSITSQIFQHPEKASIRAAARVLPISHHLGFRLEDIEAIRPIYESRVQRWLERRVQRAETQTLRDAFPSLTTREVGRLRTNSPDLVKSSGTVIELRKALKDTETFAGPFWDRMRSNVEGVPVDEVRELIEGRSKREIGLAMDPPVSAERARQVTVGWANEEVTERFIEGCKRCNVPEENLQRLRELIGERRVQYLARANKGDQSPGLEL